MERNEVTERFNALPKRHRVTIIASELETEIRWIEHEKRAYIESHQKNIRRINQRIKILIEDLRKLKD